MQSSASSTPRTSSSYGSVTSSRYGASSASTGSGRSGSSTYGAASSDEPKSSVRSYSNLSSSNASTDSADRSATYGSSSSRADAVKPTLNSYASKSSEAPKNDSKSDASKSLGSNSFLSRYSAYKSQANSTPSTSYAKNQPTTARDRSASRDRFQRPEPAESNTSSGYLSSYGYSRSASRERPKPAEDNDNSSKSETSSLPRYRSPYSRSATAEVRSSAFSSPSSYTQSTSTSPTSSSTTTSTTSNTPTNRFLRQRENLNLARPTRVEKPGESAEIGVNGRPPTTYRSYYGNGLKLELKSPISETAEPMAALDDQPAEAAETPPEKVVDSGAEKVAAVPVAAGERTTFGFVISRATSPTPPSESVAGLANVSVAPISVLTKSPRLWRRPGMTGQLTVYFGADDIIGRICRCCTSANICSTNRITNLNV